MLKKRKIPMRMCVGCREMKPKAELMRVVKAQKTRALERALEAKIDDAVFEQLASQIQPEAKA